MRDQNECHHIDSIDPSGTCTRCGRRLRGDHRKAVDQMGEVLGAYNRLANDARQRGREEMAQRQVEGREFQRSEDGRVVWRIVDGEPFNTFIVTRDGREVYRTDGDFDAAALEFCKAQLTPART